MHTSAIPGPGFLFHKKKRLRPGPVSKEYADMEVETLNGMKEMKPNSTPLSLDLDFSATIHSSRSNPMHIDTANANKEK